MKHDKARQQHLRDIEYLRLLWNYTHDYKVLNKLILFEDQLRLYDKEMGYDLCGYGYSLDQTA